MPKRKDIKKILLIGSGPIAIGQGCEFDYSGVQACKVLKHEGYEVVLVNSNPATIMTDPEFADRTYIEPLTSDVLHEIIRRERPDAVLPTLGGQTALNLAMELDENGILERYQVELIGANAEAIRRAEDRQIFKEVMKGIGLELPMSGSAHTMAEALSIAATIGKWPLIIRPGFTLGGTGGGIARDTEEFKNIVKRGLAASRNSEVLIEESLLGWKEFELEVIRDRKDNCVIVCSIENFDPMGVHTGDSITVAPAQTLSDKEYQLMRDNSLKVPRFTFEKFPAADSTLGTQMKSIGEAMAIGRSFKHSFQKALRSLEIGRFGFGADGKNQKYVTMDDETLTRELARPHAERVFALHEALKRQYSVEKLHEITSIDPYFLRQLEELVQFEDTIELTAESIKQAKAGNPGVP